MQPQYSARVAKIAADPAVIQLARIGKRRRC